MAEGSDLDQVQHDDEIVVLEDLQPGRVALVAAAVVAVVAVVLVAFLATRGDQGEVQATSPLVGRLAPGERYGPRREGLRRRRPARPLAGGELLRHMVRAVRA